MKHYSLSLLKLSKKWIVGDGNKNVHFGIKPSKIYKGNQIHHESMHLQNFLKFANFHFFDRPLSDNRLVFFERPSSLSQKWKRMKFFLKAKISTRNIFKTFNFLYSSENR